MNCWHQELDHAHTEDDVARSARDYLTLWSARELEPVTLGWREMRIDSPEDVRRAFALAGVDIDSTRDNVLAALDHPLAALVRDYRDARKRETTYGLDWLKHVATDGRVYPQWVQLGSRAGRMSCRAPNMQQLPRG